MVVHCRWMIRRDLAQALEIENDAFGAHAWTEAEFIRCLRIRNCIAMVAERDDRVLGFMLYELHPQRLHLMNFAVAQDWQRRGVGRAMIEKLQSKLSADRRNRIQLEVRETNLDAQLFFKAMGFRAISILRDIYDDTTEDAYLMEYRYSNMVEANAW